MSAGGKIMTDGTTRLERGVQRVLNAGVKTSSGCLALGLFLEMIGAAGVGRVLLHAGLIILMATPVARVAISAREYALQRDWIFVLLTTVVLLELLGSLVAAVR